MSGANENQPGSRTATVTSDEEQSESPDAPPRANEDEPSSPEDPPSATQTDGDVEDAEAEQNGGADEPEPDEDEAIDADEPEPDADEAADADEPEPDTDEAADGDTDRGRDEDMRVRASLEAMFFAADEPLPMKALLTALDTEDEAPVRRALGQMKLEWSGDSRGIHVVEVAGGYQMRTNPTYNQAVLELLEAKPTKLSRAAMETLAIVAYRQPVTKAVVDDIRGVDCGGVLRSLTDVELIAVIGKADDIGRPNLYGTTTRFLEFFGLDSLTGLPTLEDFEMDALELLGEDFDDLLADAEAEAEQEDEEDEEEVHSRKPREWMSGKALTPSREAKPSPDDQPPADPTDDATSSDDQTDDDDEDHDGSTQDTDDG